MWLQTPHTPLTIWSVILLCCFEDSVIMLWLMCYNFTKASQTFSFFLSNCNSDLFLLVISCSGRSKSTELNFSNNYSLCVCVHRSLLHGLHLVHPGRQAGQGPPMWLVSHPWLRWRNQTPTWKARLHAPLDAELKWSFLISWLSTQVKNMYTSIIYLVFYLRALILYFKY